MCVIVLLTALLLNSLLSLSLSLSLSSLSLSLSLSLALLLSLTPGYHIGRMGRHHVLCHGRSLLLQFHLFHIAHHSKYTIVIIITVYYCVVFPLHIYQQTSISMLVARSIHAKKNQT